LLALLGGHLRVLDALGEEARGDRLDLEGHEVGRDVIDRVFVAEERRRVLVLAAEQVEGVAAMNCTGVAVRPTCRASK
jgi:hypothetical protein